MTLAEIAAALGKPLRDGRGWKCLCPCHDDRAPSLSIVEKDGKLLVKCRAGCDQTALVTELKQRGLWPNGHDGRSDFRIVESYDYRDEDGKLLFQVCRLHPKTFRQRRPDGNGGWEWSTTGTRMVPYRLPELVAAVAKRNGHPPRVYVVEGEKDVDRVRSQWGVTATCNPGGAGKWRGDFARYFVGADVVIVPDNDEAGHKHAQNVARDLARKAASVRVVELSGLSEKGDISNWMDAGASQSDLETLVETTPPFDEPNRHDAEEKRRFNIIDASRLALNKAAAYLVKNLIPAQGLIVIWGPPKCGKSFWILDVVFHIALGWEYRGRRVKQGLVLYIGCEGEFAVPARVEAFRQEKIRSPIDPEQFKLILSRLDLVGEVEQLIGDIEAQLDAQAPAIIVIDTLNRSLAGSESSDEDMGNYVKAADRLRERFNCAVAIIHHCGINDSRPRGHTSLAGAADAQIAVKKDGEGLISTAVEFMKDGPEGEETHSRFNVITNLDVDEDGEPITSCVIEPVEGTAPTRSRSETRPRTPRRSNQQGRDDPPSVRSHSRANAVRARRAVAVVLLRWRHLG
jgi:hypothetical protein